MSEENTQPIEEATEEVAPIEPQVATKSRKIRSELQLKALENARQKSYKIRAEQAAIKKQNTKQVESKKTAHVSFELPEEVSTELHEELPEDLNEHIREDVKTEVAAEESHTIERIERHAERQQFNDHINNLIDERFKYKPIVKSKYKLVNEVYVVCRKRD